MSGSETPDPSKDGQLSQTPEDEIMDDVETNASAAQMDEAIEELSETGGEEFEKRMSRSRAKKNSSGEDELKEKKEKLQLTKLQNENKTIKKQNEKHKKEIVELNAKCTSLVVEKKQHEASIDKLKRQCEFEISKLQEMWESTKQEMADMKHNNDLEVKRLNRSNEAAMNLLKIENTRLADQLARLPKEKENVDDNASNTKIKMLEGKNRKLNDSFTKLNQSNQELQHEISKLKSTVDALHKEKSDAVKKTNEAALNELKLQHDLTAVNQLLEKSEKECKKLEKLLQECKTEKNELLEQLDNSCSEDVAQAKPQGLVIHDKIMEKVASKLDDRFDWTYRMISISSMKSADYSDALDSADLVLFLVGSSDIRDGMTGKEAFGKLSSVLDGAKNQAKVVIAETAPTFKTGATGHVTVLNYRLSKVPDTTFIESNPIMVKDEMLNENDELSDEALTAISEKINRELTIPVMLKSQSTTKIPESEPEPSRTTSEFVEVQANLVGRVIGQRGTTITALTKKFKVGMRVGKWGEPRKDDKEKIEMKMDGVIVSGPVKNVSSAIVEIRRIVNKDYNK